MNFSEFFSVFSLFVRFFLTFTQQLWQQNHPLMTLTTVWIIIMQCYQTVTLIITALKMMIHIIRFLMSLYRLMKKVMRVIWWIILESRNLWKKLAKTSVSQ
ncbi:MAG: 17 kDa unknown protein [Taraxacum cytorhabdovirus 1]|uniref:Uncharacterized protein n=1 Tax=Taraxacum cytorhabdovirus 1 TaxID=2950880 RepID=A0AAE9MRP2_9RHAB|nr:MAG: 17 kDa unknown protein [Taraxacum cytorhabdovirus 1]